MYKETEISDQQHYFISIKISTDVKSLINTLLKIFGTVLPEFLIFYASSYAYQTRNSYKDGSMLELI
jgi:hypothetical protein